MNYAKLLYLYRKHVGAGDVYLPRLHAVIKASKSAPGISRDLLRELRGELAYVGRALNETRKEAQS